MQGILPSKPSPTDSLRRVLEILLQYRLDWSEGYRGVINAGITNIERTFGAVPTLSEFDADPLMYLLRTMAHIRESGRSPRTVNNYRQALLAFWGECEERGWMKTPLPPYRDCRKVKVPKILPTAWETEQLQRLLVACGNAPKLRTWEPIHWRCLVATNYETSIRIGALIRVPVSCFSPATCELRVPGDLQKGREETCQRLHPETAQLLASMPRPAGDPRLFPWPFHKRLLWEHYEKFILIPAGLPCGPRDKFHKLRRTSYTFVFREFGLIAASEHAGHKGDMSRYYLDKRMLYRPDPLKALPPLTAGG